MFDIWKSVISGNLTDDPIARKSTEGRDYATFSVAANIDSDSTNYFTVYCFEKRHIDFTLSLLEKGSGVVLVGSVQQRKAQNSDKTYLRFIPTDICLKAAPPKQKPKEKGDQDGEVVTYEEEYV